MRRILYFLIIFSIVITGCSNKKEVNSERLLSDKLQPVSDEMIKDMKFSGLDDNNLVSLVKNNIYANLVNKIDGERYFIQNIEGKFFSKEYIEDLEFNSKKNIYFGYNLKTLEDQFDGKKYIFSFENNKTIVKEFEKYNNTFDQVVKNVAIGTGIILISITISTFTTSSSPAVSLIFAISGKDATKLALSTATISGISSAVITGIETKGNMNSILESLVLDASKGFKFGALLGTISGGMSGSSIAKSFKGVELNGLTLKEAGLIQKESGYPIDVIKDFKSIDEYKIYKKAGLKPMIINGKTALVRKIDLKYTSNLGDKAVTNLERMKKGYPPIDSSTGKAFQLHHINQDSNGTLAILKIKEHLGNSRVLNSVGKKSEIDRQEFEIVKKSFWKTYAKICGG